MHFERYTALWRKERIFARNLVGTIVTEK